MGAHWYHMTLGLKKFGGCIMYQYPVLLLLKPSPDNYTSLQRIAQHSPAIKIMARTPMSYSCKGCYKNVDVHINLTDLLGKSVASNSRKAYPVTFLSPLKNMRTASLRPGIYVCTIAGENYKDQVRLLIP